METHEPQPVPLDEIDEIASPCRAIYERGSQDMKVLVSGAGGFLGYHVVDRLLERGHSVRAIVRPASAEPSWCGAVELFRADLRVMTKLPAAFDDIDAVIHLAAATSGDEDAQFSSSVVATERFLEAMAQSVRQTVGPCEQSRCLRLGTR